jgi:tRNA A37 threonylcarbamoyltransferase TsaD
MNPLLARLPSADRLLRLWLLARQNLERETRKNPRIHFSFLAILAIVLVAFWFEIDESHSATQSRIAADAQQLAVLRRLTGQTEWKARRESIQRLRVQLESRLWDAESDGLAQANFQDLIAKLGQGANMTRLDVHVEIVGGTAASQNYRQMSATVTGVFTQASLQKLLADLASDGHMLVVDRLRIETTPTPRFEMLLSTYLRPNAVAKRT